MRLPQFSLITLKIALDAILNSQIDPSHWEDIENVDKALQ